ncbi:UDP-glucuronic acid decarboxylase 6 [Diplonema papillatum]|nr:UDP-glucuronic acid decarboxylase 6 [Diplonema papillatum]
MERRRAEVRTVVLTSVITALTCYIMMSSKEERIKTSPKTDELISKVYQLRNDVRDTLTKNREFPGVADLPSSMKKRILVTGGAGFVGSNLVDVLMQEGHQVTVMDNFFTGRMENIVHWVGHPNFNLIEHDVVDRFNLVVEQVYHLASPASPPHYMFDPLKTIETNTIGTKNVLEIGRSVGARILFTSTSEVYGDPKVNPQAETYWGNVNPIGPRACYDEAKRLGETMMYSYRQQYHVDVRVVRIFNTFGPRMHPNDGRVVSNFIIQSLQGRSLSIYGSGQQTRSFQFVDDLVRGIKMAMEGNYSNPINLGNPDEYTVKQFAEIIKELTKSTSEIKFLEASIDDPSQRRPNIDLAWKVLGWKPQIAVREGLITTIAYFKKQLEKNGGHINTIGQKPKRPGYLDDI